MTSILNVYYRKRKSVHPFHILRYAVIRGNDRILNRVAPETLKFGLAVAIKELRGEAELFRRWVRVRFLYLMCQRLLQIAGAQIMYREAVHASSLAYGGFRNAGNVSHPEMTEHLRGVVSQHRFDTNILFSTMEDIDGWLQKWETRI